jgi:argininosuccinate lyase
MAGAEFDTVRMRARADEGLVTITELADTLARDEQLPFRSAHATATRMVKAAGVAGGALSADLLAAVSEETLGRVIRWTDDRLARVLSPEHFIAVRRTPGGPAPEVAGAAVEASRALLRSDEALATEREAALAAAETARAAALAAL